MSFQDYFSGHADDYARYRPRYPEALFRYLAGISPSRQRAWDCATGNGQAATGLAAFFDEVVATDASGQQISQAEAHPKVRYRVAPAEDSGLPPAAVDLVTVAQAVHWFDFDKFFAEVRRVAVPRGILALWGYRHLRCNPEIDRIYLHYYHETVAAYFPPDRKYVEEKYRGIPFPFPELQAPELAMEMHWSLEDLIGYLGTWSATKNYSAATGKDPIPELREQFKAVWGDPNLIREVRWPLFFRIGRVG